MNSIFKFRIFQMKAWFMTAIIIAMAISFFIQNCTKEKIIIYGIQPDKVTLVSPPNSLSPLDSVPVFNWRSVNEAVNYQIQIATDIVFTDLIIDSAISDTFYSPGMTLDDNTYYWRVRAKNSDNFWGDWSEAIIWSFRIDIETEYIELVAQIQTPGTAQDILVQGDVAYVADGQSDLTLIDVADPTNPTIIGNIDLYGDDFAKAVWKVPADDYAYVADMDGKVQVLNVVDLESPFNYNYGLDQNLEELTGLYIDDIVDTIYIFTVSSLSRRRMQFYQFVYDEVIPRPGDMYAPNAIEFPADGNGVYFDSMSVFIEYYRDSTYYEQIMGKFIFAAVGEAGLWMVNISDNHTFNNPDTTIQLLNEPRLVGWQDTPSIALSVQTRGGYAYVADDRGGLQIFDLPDTVLAFDHKDPRLIDPVLIANLNTSGRTKDVHLVGDYCYLADGSKGLKIINVADPYNPVFEEVYDTPYAYGLWADEDYIYVADRDNGIMIFENRVF
jgi:hypothetical protein